MYAVGERTCEHTLNERAEAHVEHIHKREECLRPVNTHREPYRTIVMIAHSLSCHLLSSSAQTVVRDLMRTPVPGESGSQRPSHEPMYREKTIEMIA